MTTAFTEEDRLAALVKAKLVARLRDFNEVERDTTEVAYIVRWQSEHEHGTHRACLSLTDDREMLVWGHYLADEHDARRDFDERINR